MTVFVMLQPEKIHTKLKKNTTLYRCKTRHDVKRSKEKESGTSENASRLKYLFDVSFMNPLGEESQVSSSRDWPGAHQPHFLGAPLEFPLLRLP